MSDDDLKSGTLNVGELFSEKFFFRVPEYQRPFLWTDDDLDQLITDISEAPRDQEYFLGTLVFHSRGSGGYDLIDGQQRVTALCILLACLRDHPALADEVEFSGQLHAKVFQTKNDLDGIPEKNRIEVRDQAMFNAMVATKGGTVSVPTETPKSAAARRYLIARDVFTQALADLSTAEVKELSSFISMNCVVMFLSTSSFERSFRLFTIVNDRGQQLRRIDVLKAENLDPEVLPSDVARKRYAQEWEANEERLGESHFEELIFHMRLIYVKDKPKSDVLTEFKTRVFAPKVSNGLKMGKAFFDEVQKYADLYNSLFVDCDILDTEDGERLDARYRSMIFIMKEHFIASEWRACLLAYAEKFGREGFFDFLMAIEKVYLREWVEGIRKDERYSTYTTILTAISSKTSGAKVTESLDTDLTPIEEACRVSNFYSVGYSKYLLLRSEILASELDHPRLFKARSIEHVLPQSPAPGGKWRADFTDDEIDQFVHTAGNLVLLSKSKNSSAGNKEFAEKKTKYLKPRVTDFPRSAAVLAEQEWTSALIQARTELFATTVLATPAPSK